MGKPEAEPSPVPVPPGAGKVRTSGWPMYMCTLWERASLGSSAVERVSPTLPHGSARSLAHPAELHGAHQWAPCPPGLSATLVKAAGVSLEQVFHQGPMGALEMKTNLPLPPGVLHPSLGAQHSQVRKDKAEEEGHGGGTDSRAPGRERRLVLEPGAWDRRAALATLHLERARL